MLIRLADRIICADTLYPYIEDYCRDYAVNEQEAENEPDISITITPKDIECERERFAKEDMAAGNPVRQFSGEYLETLAVYRKIAERMPDHDTFLFHGSAVAVDGQAYIFTAKSGTGKSTHTGLWRQVFGDRAVMVNDDKPLIRIKKTGEKCGSENGFLAYVYGTPWDGKHRLSSPVSVPVKAVCILERGKENRIVKIDKKTAMPEIIAQSYRPFEPASLHKTLSLIDSLTESVGLFRMECNMDPDAARMSYEVMSGAKERNKS